MKLYHYTSLENFWKIWVTKELLFASSRVPSNNDFFERKKSISFGGDVNPIEVLTNGKRKLKDYFKALNLNGLIYASALGFDSGIAIDALQAGAIASGLSGTGSSFVAVCDENSCDDIKDAWSSLEGRVIETEVDNNGCTFL